ncbi:MAG: hypothetical protein ACKODX_15065 [Gemmata sp.]
MSVSYTCPNPECGVTLKTPARVQVGKSVKCPKCSKPFVPEPADKEKAPAAAGVLKLADEPKPTPPPPPPKPFVDDDDEDDASVKKGYGVVAETEEEKAKAEENKPSFGEIQDKHKKSARGPAMALLVMPTNLLTLEGLLTGIGGLLLFLVGMWPLVFNDAPPGEEETQEAIVYMMLGLVTLFWGAMVCFGASQMQELASLPWAMIGAVMGVVPLLVGIYAIVMLQNPEVKAGFAETDGGADEDEEEDDDEEEDEEEDKKKKKGKGAKKVSKKASEDDDE